MSLRVAFGMALVALPASPILAAEFVNAGLNVSTYGYLTNQADAQFSSDFDTSFAIRNFVASTDQTITRAHSGGVDSLALTSSATVEFASATRLSFVDGPSTLDFAVAAPNSGFSYGQTGANFSYSFRLSRPELLSVSYNFSKSVLPRPAFGLGTDPARLLVVRSGQFPPLVELAVKPNESGTYETLLGAGSYSLQLLSIVNWGLVGTGVTSVSGTTRFDIALAAVPESSTWAMLLGGFGLIGCAARARRTNRRSQREKCLS